MQTLLSAELPQPPDKSASFTLFSLTHMRLLLSLLFACSPARAADPRVEQSKFSAGLACFVAPAQADEALALAQGGRFAVGAGGKLVWSADGKKWEAANELTKNGINRVVRTGGPETR